MSIQGQRKDVPPIPLTTSSCSNASTTPQSLITDPKSPIQQRLSEANRRNTPSKAPSPYTPTPGYKFHHPRIVTASLNNRARPRYLPPSPLSHTPSSSPARPAPSASPLIPSQIKQNLLFIQLTIASVCHLLLHPDDIPKDLATDYFRAIDHLNTPSTFSKLSTIISQASDLPLPIQMWTPSSAYNEPSHFLENLSQVEQSLIQQLTILDPSTPKTLRKGTIALEQLKQNKQLLTREPEI